MASGAIQESSSCASCLIMAIEKIEQLCLYASVYPSRSVFAFVLSSEWLTSRTRLRNLLHRDSINEIIHLKNHRHKEIFSFCA